MLMRGRGREDKEAEEKKDENKLEKGQSQSIPGNNERGSASSSTQMSSESRGASKSSGNSLFIR